MKDIHSLQDIEEDTFLIYKHSITCPVSAQAQKIVQKFEESTSIPTYRVVVQMDEELKLEIAEKYGVKHETPQIIAIKNRKVVGSADHYNIENIEQYF